MRSGDDLGKREGKARRVLSCVVAGVGDLTIEKSERPHGWVIRAVIVIVIVEARKAMMDNRNGM